MMHTLADTITREIRAEMGRQRLTQREIAEQHGISRTQISRRFAGLIEFKPSELEKIADYLGVPVTQFVGAEPATASAA
jgi:transcriptional regulator with XRE-family HTH domain